MKYTIQMNGPDVRRWALPAGATARLGRGRNRGGLIFSSDGEALIVPTDIGCWWYDLDTLTPSALWATERGMVSAISCSHDGQWIATRNWDDIVKVWDTQNLHCVAQIEPLQPAGNYITFSPDGHHLALICFTLTATSIAVYDWRADTTTPVANFDFTRIPRVYSATSAAFSVDGRLFAYTSDYNMTSVMDIETGEILSEFPDTYTEGPAIGATELVFSPCGEYLAGCNRKDKVHIWHIRSGALEMEPTVYLSDRLLPTYLSDGTLRVATRYQKEVAFWDAKRQEKVDAFEYLGGTGGAACFSIDGRRFATVSRYDNLHVWTEGSPSKVVSLPGHLHPDPVERFPSTLVFSKDSRTLFCGYWKRVGFLAWDASRRQIARTFPQKSDECAPHPNMVFTMSRDAERIATANTTDSPIRVWDIPSETQVAEFLEVSWQVAWLTLSPTGEYLVSSMNPGHAKVWHVSSGAQVTELTEAGKSLSEGFRMTVFSPTGEYLLSLHKESVSVWDARKWEYLYESPLKNFKRSGRALMFGTQLRFHPNGKHFFTSGYEEGAFVWYLKSGEQVGVLPTEICLDTTRYRGKPQDIQGVREHQETLSRRIRGLQVSPCGTFIAGAMQNEIRVWYATTLETKMVIIPPAGCQKPFTLAFSPCSRYLAAGAWWQAGQTKMSIRLWETATGENIATFWAHPTDIDRLAFSPDGKYLASGSYDGTVLLWDMKPYL